MTCTSCHANAPATGRHPGVFSSHDSLGCSSCHGTGYSSSTVVRGTHVNGTVEKATGINWQASPKSCDPSCHGPESW
jgi:hypothetical protein